MRIGEPMMADFMLVVVSHCNKWSTKMDRREFVMGAGTMGFAATVAAWTSERIASAATSKADNFAPPDNAAAQYLPDTSDVMTGAPPPADKQVTRDNREDSQAKMRWAMQHWRELYPTQRVRRSEMPSVLPRKNRDLKALAFLDTTGQATTVGRQLDLLDVNAFIVLTRGKIEFEEYRHGMTPDTPHFTASVYKSIVATVIAALIGEGTLQETKTIESYVPEVVGKAIDGATVRQLLDMESGVKYGYVGPDSEFSRHKKSIGPDAQALGVPVGNYAFLRTLDKERQHGERLRYKEADPLSLAWAAEKTTGKRFADLLQERVWARMGAEFDADATCDPLGQWTFYLSVTLRDLARWGLMCLNDGKVNSEQVVPARFFGDLRENASVEKLMEMPLAGKFFPEGVGYRSFFYHQRKSGAIAAAGAMGQFCYINRRHQTVVAFFSTTPPSATRETTTKDLESAESFERDCRLERERWHLCHEIAKASEELSG